MSDIDTLARTIWAEARGEGVAGMEAVAAVIMNRCRLATDYLRRKPEKKRHALFGDGSPESACRVPWQFSAWNLDDPNRDKLVSVTSKDPWFAHAIEIAKRAVKGELPDPTNQADHYCTEAVAPHTSWTAGRTPVAKIGRHLFFRLA